MMTVGDITAVRFQCPATLGNARATATTVGILWFGSEFCSYSCAAFLSNILFVPFSCILTSTAEGAKLPKCISDRTFLIFVLLCSYPQLKNQRNVKLKYMKDIKVNLSTYANCKVGKSM